jgi:serine/threonine-protein kinase
MFILAICTAVFYGCAVYALYIALEPQVRRRWPHTLISWTAILTGQWRDPIVGRDVLVGTALAIGFPVLGNAVNAALGSNVPPRLGSTDVLLGFRGTLAICFQSMPHGIRDTLVFALVLFLLRAILRNQWLAMGAFAVIFTLQTTIGSSHFVIDSLEQLVAYTLVAAAVWRFGLLALAVFILANNTVGNMQATLHTGAWYFGNSLFLIACGLALAVWGCYTSMAGQKLWKTSLFET